MWREAQSLPAKFFVMGSGQSVIIGHKVFVEGWLKTLEKQRKQAAILAYDTIDDRWEEPQFMPVYDAAVAKYRSKLTLVGGAIDDDTYAKQVYQLENEKWISSVLPEMLTARSGASAIGKENDLIVAGGFNEYGKTNVVEMYRSSENKWEAVQSLPKPCYRMKSIVNNDIWYLCGGTGQGGEVYQAAIKSFKGLYKRQYVVL